MWAMAPKLWSSVLVWTTSPLQVFLQSTHAFGILSGEVEASVNYSNRESRMVWRKLASLVLVVFVSSVGNGMGQPALHVSFLVFSVLDTFFIFVLLVPKLNRTGVQLYQVKVRLTREMRLRVSGCVFAVDWYASSTSTYVQARIRYCSVPFSSLLRSVRYHVALHEVIIVLLHAR